MSSFNKNPLLSIIIPAYNAEKHIERAINSILEQTYLNIEIIVVNDGSIDDTGKVVSNYGNKVIYYSQSNNGVSAARNFGITKANGSYIGFLDADDFVLPNTYSDMINALRIHNLDFVMCNMMYEKENGTRMKGFNKKDFILDLNLPTDLIKLFSININSSCNKIFKKDILHDVQFPKLKRGEDAIFVMQVISKARKAAYLSNTFYCYFDNSNSVTNEEITINAIENYIEVNRSKKIIFTESKNTFLENVLIKDFVLAFLRYTRRIMKIDNKFEKEMCWKLWLNSNKNEFLVNSYISPILYLQNINAVYFLGMIFSGNFFKPLLKRFRNLFFFMR